MSNLETRNLIKNQILREKYERKKLLNKKSKRKQNVIKKVHELARVADLKVTVIIYDPKSNVMQEFNTANDFNIDNIIEH